MHVESHYSSDRLFYLYDNLKASLVARTFHFFLMVLLEERGHGDERA